MSQYSVELRDVVKFHGATAAVNHVSLQIHKGEFFSVLGPSGSGKTTTLRLLAGFEQPDQGDILIEGRSMRSVPPNYRPVNLVFQHFALFPHLTVFQNIAFGLEMKRVSGPEVARRVQDALGMVKLTGKERRLPAQLSGGEQQRVALARALVNHPTVLLLDEPLGALDQALRQDMQVELKAIQERVGITFVYVTHDQDEALTMSDRLAVMDHGRVLQVGTPQEIYEAPATAFVANFIGVSNCVSGRITAINGTRCAVIVPDLPEAPVLQARRPASAHEGRTVTLSLRPERLHLSRESGAGGFDNCVPARVEKVIYAGNETQYHLNLSDRVRWMTRVPNTGIDQKPLAAGEAVIIRWNADEGVVLTE